MLCEKYNNLSVIQKREAIGEILHAFQSDDEIFTAIMDIVQDAKIKGTFDNVLFFPERENAVD